MIAETAGIEKVKSIFSSAQEVVFTDASDADGGQTPAERDAETINKPPQITIYSAREILVSQKRAQWSLYPYIEADATTLMSGERGTFKSFIALDWACRAAVGMPAIGYSHSEKPQRVLVVSAEGKGLKKRLQGWLAHNNTSDPILELFYKNLRFIEQPVNLSSGATIYDLNARLADMSFEPEFVIVDTLTRNSDGNIEESNSKAQQYLCQLDTELRSRYRCAILLVHHLGKDHGRGHRGPSSLANNTEAEIIVSRPDSDSLSASVEFGRVKDREPPKPFVLDAKRVETGETDEVGQPDTTLVMVEGQYSAEAKERKRPKVIGKHQQALLSALAETNEQGATVSFSRIQIRELLKIRDIPKQRHTETVDALVRAGHLNRISDDIFEYKVPLRSVRPILAKC